MAGTLMQAFLLLDLTATAAYYQPLIAQVKQQWPGAAALDVDAQSDALLLHFALQLLRQAEQAVVLVKAHENTPGFGNILPLVEELLLAREGRLILLLGRHPRLERMLRARPHVQFRQVQSEAGALQKLALYFA